MLDLRPTVSRGLAAADGPGDEPASPTPAEPSHRNAAKAASGIRGREPWMRAANAKLRCFDGPVDFRPTSGFGGQREILP